MKKSFWVYLSIVIVALTGLLSSCKKKEVPITLTPVYDLFPLKVGNEFYYNYSYDYKYDPTYGPFKKSSGNRKWRILTDSLKVNSVEYSFEEKYNGVEISTIVIPKTIVDTVIIKDSVRYFKVIEDNSGQLSFWNINTTWNITLQRFQKDSDIVIHNWVGTNYGRDYQFHANKGLIHYSNSKGPISNQYYENYKLDSVKILH